MILNKLTKGPADTVFQILKKTKINSSKEILIKDCDTFFNRDDTKGNVISVVNIKDFNILKNLKGKSFVKINEVRKLKKDFTSIKKGLKITYHWYKKNY